jgi:hypothetical protein
MMLAIDRELVCMTWQAKDEAGRVSELLVWPAVIARVQPGAKVSKTILEAAEIFALRTGLDPDVAYIRELPAGAPEFVRVGTATLTVGDWVEPGYVVLGNTDIKRTVVQCLPQKVA